MLKLSRFRGGVHPPYNKRPQNERAIVPLAPGDTLKVPLSQHIGAPCVPVVNVGDYVKLGQLIGEVPEGKLGARIHSPVSGTVTGFEMIPHQSGGFCKCAVIANDGRDELDPSIDREGRDVDAMTPDEITEAVRNAGIVGMGGAGFPTAVKISSCRGKTIEFCIANGAECEPYLSCDDRVMVEHSEDVVRGVVLLSRAVNARVTVIAIEKNKPAAIKCIEAAVASLGAKVTVVQLPVKYPQGGEKQLIKAIMNAKVPSGKLPADVGAAIFNVSSCAAVYNACRHNMPLVTTTVTVAGSCIKSPENFEARVGTPFAVLAAACGGFCEDPAKVISGGPMTGAALSTLETPVTKTTTGLITFTAEEVKGEYDGACIRCGKCVGVCPMGLSPFLFAAYGEVNNTAALTRYHVKDCIECGCCAYVCTGRVPLIARIRAGKARVAIAEAEAKEKAAKAKEKEAEAK
ncbi:MAG: electron transport complex subunit RsxC [Clostridia bacterium]|nr:electron transport complex subunit RsxC [Clostridia bacterium]MBR4439722.1 electron transport complex subunit RsxC [Clostridia bacterium]MBR5942738.1 electron transport complex subunit RsxC [Clostridia bacterium]